ncbi:hypothetical protein WA026_021643 [Henosepilachna vigintioctopunctata]|uniref:Uncharacterized protein n=1 Tax=Henosepilachna vigintioctopunctata TaxID=420089 RepID=A0AAW1UCL5_9CUCU
MLVMTRLIYLPTNRDSKQPHVRHQQHENPNFLQQYLLYSEMSVPVLYLQVVSLNLTYGEVCSIKFTADNRITVADSCPSRIGQGYIPEHNKNEVTISGLGRKKEETSPSLSTAGQGYILEGPSSNVIDSWKHNMMNATMTSMNIGAHFNLTKIGDRYYYLGFSETMTYIQAFRFCSPYTNLVSIESFRNNKSLRTYFLDQYPGEQRVWTLSNLDSYENYDCNTLGWRRNHFMRRKLNCSYKIHFICEL